MRRKHSFPTKLIFFLLGFMLLQLQCAYNPVTGKRELMLMSESQELAMGKQSDPEIIKFFGLYQDEKMQGFINEKGKKMGSISHRPNLEYKFRIVDSPVVNAFALPGGFVYFTRGIMAHFNNEAEFAGVLGHEIGHITARHSAKQYSQTMVAQLGFVVGMVVSEDFREYSELASVSMGLLFLKFGRGHESQSDKLGVEYSTKIGYDSHEMANFFGTLKRLQTQSGGAAVPTFMSTHPDPGERNRKVHQHTVKMQEELNAKDLKVNRNDYLRMIDGLVYGEDPRQGYVKNDNFYHPELRFQFPIPQGWKLANSASQVQIAPENGKALLLMTLAAETTLQAAKSATIAQDSLKVIDSKSTRVGGFPALEFTADLNKEVRILTYLIKYDGRIYKFHGLAETAQFNQYRNTFLATMKNFKKLTDPSKINVKADRIRVKTVRRNGTLKDALAANGVSNNKMDELSILNGMELNAPVKKGMLIKVLGK